MSRLLMYEVLLSSVLLVFCTAIESALADEFVVDGPTTMQNGGFPIDDHDTLTITEDGSIATSGTTEHAVNSNGDPDGAVSNTVINNGVISATGAGAGGIYGSDSLNMSVINNGTVTTGGDDSYGIYIKAHSDSSRIINNGTVTTLGPSSDGMSIEESNGSSIENYGSVVVEGQYSYGISSFYSDDSMIINAGSVLVRGDVSGGLAIGDTFRSTIINRGSVTTEGDDVYALEIGGATGARVVNSGSILSKGQYGIGIANGYSTDTEIFNSGSIRMKAADGYGIYSIESAGAIVTNSGLVVSEQSYAIVLEDGDTELNLSTTGYIGGAIRFARPATVNLTTGASHSVLWDLSDGMMTGDNPASISGDAPWFYNAATKQFATYDPSVFAGAIDQLGDMTGLLSGVGRNARGKDGVWVTGFGGDLRHTGDGVVSLDRDIRQYGVAIGYNGQTDDGTRWGVMGGHLRSERDIDSAWASSYDIESNGWFAGANGARNFGAVTIDAGLIAGRIGDSSRRFVNDNLALTNGLTLGESWADASYDGWFVAPELGIGASFEQAHGWTLTPAARLRYAGQWTEGFTETGSNANATVDRLALGLFAASAEVAAAKAFAFGSLSTRLGYQARRSVGDKAATVALIDISSSVGFGDTDSQAAYAGVALDFKLAPGARLNVDVTGYFGDNVSGAQAAATFTSAF